MGIFDDIIGKLVIKAKHVAEAAPDPAAAPDSTLVAPLVDVGAVIVQFVSVSGEDLNWRTSNVDMLKALGLDSSPAHRKALAEELKYDRDMNDSASMNMWLHQKVRQALAASGGKLLSDLA
ncbi:DUF3597 domain-containing protein [Burkholderia lata]|uniref:DUF3597 domain-containing protein n=1 Tax=Burkholderia lata (strain ATCC 17760 / DSM 23089 / LMG 22485 / NCIMB 9086 / R18194 / 383) TaxID=482957 RepID=A0A6P2QAN2_BURL3|nr:DUF3597 domain-containing protein [Burkholderia lata]VWC17104.1 hypothetical protein BLA6863_05662 [Burkholderia lata]